jgi:cell shape-determining protein MreD
MPTLTQKRRRLQFWYRAAIAVLFVAVVGTFIFGWRAELGSFDRKFSFWLGVVMSIQLISLSVRVTRQLREIKRTGDPELLDNAYQEHVIDKGSYVYKNQVKTWM